MRQEENYLFRVLRLAVVSIGALLVLMVLLLMLLLVPPIETSESGDAVVADTDSWHPPDSTLIPSSPEGDLIRYGRELVSHTSLYLGPNGSVSKQSNGMNCQNCHLQSGKKIWGNNYAAVASTYPKFRHRSGTIESIEKRVNDCIQRSLNGQAFSEESRELKALVSYIKWVGSEVQPNEIPHGAGIVELPFMERAADPQLGKQGFASHCARCHGAEGEGMRDGSVSEWHYPPLWGENSFNTGAGILRLSRMAGFVFKNMPNDNHEVSELTQEEAWDIAAYICSQPRPVMDIAGDWPEVAQKPFDHPYGPYADSFTESQHRYGPFGPIVAASPKK